MHNEIFRTRDAETRFFIFLAIGLSLIMTISYVIGSQVERKDVSTPTEVVRREFPQVSLIAKSAYVYDARTETILYAHNEDLRLPLASLTKVMTALVAYELSPEYGTVTVSREALMAQGDSGLLAGERWRLKDLLDFSLITSSNDGMRAVALALGALERSEVSSEIVINDFVDEMNKKAATLDLKDTYFWNETGLDESDVKGGAYGTAKDISMLMNYIVKYRPEILEATRDAQRSFSSLDDLAHEARNTNALAGVIPGLVASKTGFTNNAGGNLTLVFDPELGRPIVITVLGSTERGRFEDAKKLIDATMAYLTQE